MQLKQVTSNNQAESENKVSILLYVIPIKSFIFLIIIIYYLPSIFY